MHCFTGPCCLVSRTSRGVSSSRLSLPVSVLLALKGNLPGAVHDVLCLADAQWRAVTCRPWSWLQGSLGSLTVLLDWT